MKIEQNANGTWDVRNNKGKIVATLASNEAAWHWLDRHEVHPSHLTKATAERIEAVDVKR